jgi:hypothetical protein
MLSAFGWLVEGAGEQAPSVMNHRGRLLVAALGFAELPRPSYDRSLWAFAPGWTRGPGLGMLPWGCTSKATTRN